MKNPLRSSLVECELTIDDGPSVYTEPLLAALARLERRAVFFVVGQHIHEHPRQLAAIAEAGHEIGNHTFDHVALDELDEAGIRDQLIRCNEAIEAHDCNEAIEAHDISTPTLFRPPFGRTSPTVVEVAEELGMQQLLWHVTPEDWRPDAPPRETRRAVVRAGPDAVVLLHERANTVEALRQLHG